MTGIIFDMDGVLLDSMPFWYTVNSLYLEQKGKVAKPNLNEVIFTMSMGEGALYMKNEYELEESAEEIIDAINQMGEHFYREEVQLKPGVLEFLQKNRDLPMVIATSTDKQLAVSALKRLGVLSYFKEVLSCSDFPHGKSRPEIFYAAVQILGTEIGNTWVIEDSLYASQTAKKLDLKCVGFMMKLQKKMKNR
ncbi:putative hydrolase [Lachnospiraceae bacterium TWA4]|nr:putative hydrolase [Lachnospiraceae bacterium TWA4]